VSSSYKRKRAPIHLILQDIVRAWGNVTPAINLALARVNRALARAWDLVKWNIIATLLASIQGLGLVFNARTVSRSVWMPAAPAKALANPDVTLKIVRRTVTTNTVRESSQPLGGGAVG
jgi:hypothetical protein